MLAKFRANSLADGLLFTTVVFRIEAYLLARCLRSFGWISSAVWTYFDAHTNSDHLKRDIGPLLMQIMTLLFFVCFVFDMSHFSSALFSGNILHASKFKYFKMWWKLTSLWVFVLCMHTLVNFCLCVCVCVCEMYLWLSEYL